MQNGAAPAPVQSCAATCLPSVSIMLACEGTCRAAAFSWCFTYGRCTACLAERCLWWVVLLLSLRQRAVLLCCHSHTSLSKRLQPQYLLSALKGLGYSRGTHRPFVVADILQRSHTVLSNATDNGYLNLFEMAITARSCLQQVLAPSRHPARCDAHTDHSQLHKLVCRSSASKQHSLESQLRLAAV